MSHEFFDISPVDAWFFRDGRPYNAGETTQSGVESLFPPLAPTVVGALRAALARGKAWPGHGRWTDALIAVLGDGFEERAGRLGQLRFCGPYVLERGRPVFPAPLHLLGVNDPNDSEHPWKPATLLTPGPEVLSDMGRVHFPVPRKHAEGLKDAGERYLSVEGLAAVLAGEVPEHTHVRAPSKLWKHEPRVGLVRDPLTRTTGEAALYSPRYVRLKEGVSLAMGVEGLPDDWKLPSLFTLGGESRMAASEPLADFDLEAMLPAPAHIPEGGGLTVTLLTPGLFEFDENRLQVPGPGDALPGLEGAKVVSACVGKPVFVGGWNTLAREPLPLTPYLPAGTTWFCTVEPAHADAILARHLGHIGQRTAYGFGQIALGVWHDDHNG